MLSGKGYFKLLLALAILVPSTLAHAQNCGEAVQILIEYSRAELSKPDPRAQKSPYVKPERSTFDVIANPLIGALMRLRYRFAYKGINEIRAKGNKGILFLPDHYGWGVDPIFVWLALNKEFRPRLALGESQAQGAAMKWLIKELNIIVIPELLPGGNDAVFSARMQVTMKEIADGLARGDNFVFYPAGQISRKGIEDLQGKSGVRRILDLVEDPRIVLIRQRGLWGSSLTFGATGSYPAAGAAIKAGMIATLANLIVFNPKRDIEISAFEPTDFPLNGTREQIRKYLEEYYNREPEKNIYVPLYFLVRSKIRESASTRSRFCGSPGSPN